LNGKKETNQVVELFSHVQVLAQLFIALDWLSALSIMQKSQVQYL